MIASQFDGIKEKAIGTAIQLHLAIHTNDESLAVGGMAGDVNVVGQASVVQGFLWGLDDVFGRDSFNFTFKYGLSIDVFLTAQ